MPPGFPVRMEIGSSSTAGGAGSKFEQETRSRQSKADAIFFIGCVH
jgi:hypothetical protein